MPRLNLSLNYFDHRKTTRLIGLLGKGAEVLPLKLWCYCGKHHADDGRLAGYSPQEIETVSGWWGSKGEAVSALVRVGFLDELRGGDAPATAGVPAGPVSGYAIHDWRDHAAHFLAYRERAKEGAAARWSKHRTDRGPPDASSIAASNAGGNPRSNAKRRRKQSQCSAVQGNAVQGINPPTPQGGQEPQEPAEFDGLIPDSLRTPAFVAAWLVWERHRRQKRARLTPTAARLQLGRLERVGPERGAEVVLYAAGQGWTGIFEESTPAAGQGRTPAARQTFADRRDAEIREALSGAESEAA